MNKPKIIKHDNRWIVIGAPEHKWVHSREQDKLFRSAWIWCERENSLASKRLWNANS